MKKIIFLLIFTLLNAENYKEFYQNHIKEFQNYKANLEKEFREYKKTLNEEFEKYKKELSKYWQNPALSSKKVFVEYSKDLKTQKKVDFEKRIIEVKVIESDKTRAKLKIAKALANLSLETTKEAFNNNPVLKRVEKKLKKIGISSTPKNRPIITDVIYKKPPTKKEVVSFVKNALQNEIEIKKSKLPNQQIYILKVPLPPKTMIIKAKNYKPLVLKRAKKFNLSPSLIYAIIHTESSFNPMARSYVPAFGLMQIVPQTAGKDAYKFLYGKPKLLTPGYLYNENNNILIGSAYLNLLYYHYFKGVKNKLSRLYLTIAAYNTGAGNVACAFNSNNVDYKGNTLCYRYRGDYSIKKALPTINSMTPSQIYNHLTKRLRYKEARDYLQKVKKRVWMYHTAIKKGEL